MKLPLPMNLTRPIVVVDRRTCGVAKRKIAVLLDQGDYARAKSGLTAARLWLRQEVRTGPKRHRAGYAADLERLEAIEEEVNRELGLTG